MKILFAIQGTGNGHISRAKDVYPILKQYGDVDVLISGIQADVDFPFPVKYKLHGLSFIFGRNGGIDFLSTLFKLKLFRLLKDIKSLPVEQYDLVINDFEPVSAWACKKKKKDCISLSHQCAVLHPSSPRPKKVDKLGLMVLQRYAPTTHQYGFHFRAYAKNIFTPVIRKEIRNIEPTTLPHYTVYLPAYDDQSIIRMLSQYKNVDWHVFSKHNKKPIDKGNIKVRKIDNEAFIKSMASATGVLCGGGFEGPAEAVYLGKKLLVVPMKGQYEQQCNAAAVNNMGATLVPYFDKRAKDLIAHWIEKGKPIKADYPDMTAEIINSIIMTHAPEVLKKERVVMKPGKQKQ